METLIYLDTNIYIDHFEGRTDYLRPLGEFAFQLLKKAFDCKFNIVLSSLVVDELEHNSYSQNIVELKNVLKEGGNGIFIVETADDEQEARQIMKVHKTSFNDTKHAVLARRAGAAYLVTRNMDDFACLQDIIKVVLPEQL